MELYVVGFMFDNAMDNVVLIRKNKPEWQKGLLNGVGGKIEPGETPKAAMVREFYEETGCNTLQKDWTDFYAVNEKEFILYGFYAKNNLGFESAQTKESEEVLHVNLLDLPRFHYVPNTMKMITKALELGLA